MLTSRTLRVPRESSSAIFARCERRPVRAGGAAAGPPAPPQQHSARRVERGRDRARSPYRSAEDLPLDEPVRAGTRYLRLGADEVAAAFGRWRRPDDLAEVGAGALRAALSGARSSDDLATLDFHRRRTTRGSWRRRRVADRFENDPKHPWQHAVQLSATSAAARTCGRVACRRHARRIGTPTGAGAGEEIERRRTEQNQPSGGDLRREPQLRQPVRWLGGRRRSRSR